MKIFTRGNLGIFLLVIIMSVEVQGISLFAVSAENNEFRLQVLLVIDVSDFLCPSCLDSLIDFVQTIPSPVRKNRMTAVWRVCDSENMEKNHLKSRIWQKKMRGFISANAVDFPVWMITESGLKSVFGDGSRLLLFLPGSEEIVTYSFPLSFKDRKTVQNLLDEWIHS